MIYGGTIVGQDSATQFYPWYSYLGERLRSFQIPEWSPAQFAGGPFAADPQSGWTYLPAMLLFTILPLTLAANAYLVGHLALAGFATYALARTLGIRPLGALVAAVAYELSGPVYGRSVCCPAQLQVATWMPLLILGAEVALRRADWSARARWWGLAGLALSQILASWLGQVGYYALLVLGSYLAYRTLIDPPQNQQGGFRARVAALVLNGGAILAIGFGLAAAGIIPRLEYNRLSNVAGGVYGGEQSYAADIGGWTASATGLGDLSRSLYYPGGAVLALALMALVLVRRRHAIPYFLFLSCSAILLASPDDTPLHAILYRLLPRFEDLHTHFPERITLATYLAPALLAGATVHALPTWLQRRRLTLAVALPATVIVVAAIRWRPDTVIPWPALVAALAAVVVVAAVACLRSSLLLRLAPVALLLIVALDLGFAGPRIMSAAPYGGFHRRDLDRYYAASGAVEFLQARQTEQPVRFFGYDPEIRSFKADKPILYRDQFAQPATAALIVNNRATVFGLHDVQGYNPVQLQRFVEFLNALNGHTQEYHDANVYPDGLDSPLLDLLNVRYIVVPAVESPGRDDLARLLATYPVVYRDAEVQIVERTIALPRAWIVHAARQVEPGETLSLLANSAVDPRETALIEELPPDLERPADVSADQARVVDHAPERIELRVSTAAAGLLVLSEVSYPGWDVFVDGEPAESYVVDHLFRGVAIAPGEHTVEWRYESDSTTLGLAITLATIAGLGAAGAVPLWRRRAATRTRERHKLSPVAPSA
ncbi:MAG: hypothetical protein QOF33_4093 [Thermomicrobiales bacterium]|nr:hypothetical protein [Thermomicrobiales bacterium]